MVLRYYVTMLLRHAVLTYLGSTQQLSVLAYFGSPPFWSTPDSPPSLFAVAGVFFDPDVYMVPERDNVTLILKTNVTVNKRFGVLVNTVDDSATRKRCTHRTFCFASDTFLFATLCQSCALHHTLYPWERLCYITSDIFVLQSVCMLHVYTNCA